MILTPFQKPWLGGQKALFFNYPNNPTAATAPREFFEQAVEFAHRYQILLVHDLCYAELAFDGYQPTSLLEIPGGKEVGVEFHTLSKTYNMAGWRVGFVVGNAQIIQGLRTLKTNLDYGIFCRPAAGRRSRPGPAGTLPGRGSESLQHSPRLFNSRVCLPGMDGG